MFVDRSSKFEVRSLNSILRIEERKKSQSFKLCVNFVRMDWNPELLISICECRTTIMNYELPASYRVLATNYEYSTWKEFTNHV